MKEVRKSPTPENTTFIKLNFSPEAPRLSKVVENVLIAFGVAHGTWPNPKILFESQKPPIPQEAISQK